MVFIAFQSMTDDVMKLMLIIHLYGNAVDPFATNAQIETVQTDEPIRRWDDS